MPQAMPSVLNWHCVPFAQLSTASLYEVLQLRSAVFVVEQACIFQDLDGQDAHAMHLMGLLEAPNKGQKPDGPLVAYARCFNAGVAYPEASIGRVATHPSVRGSGAGHALIAQALSQMQALWGEQPVRIVRRRTYKIFMPNMALWPQVTAIQKMALHMFRCCGQPHKKTIYYIFNSVL